MKSDGELLTEYAEKANQEAFTEIVSRYTKMVYAVSVRVLVDRVLAEDATQATFLVLAQKARSLSGTGTLAGWLHKVAEYTARNALRGRIRRERYEREAAEERPEHQDPLEGFGDMGDHLDAALQNLPTGQRDAIVLRYMSGFSDAEVAERLGCTRTAAAMRVSRGMERLRKQLSRKGVVATATSLVAFLASQQSAIAAPSHLPQTITLASSGAETTKALILADASLRGMAYSKIKSAAAVFLFGTAAIVGTVAIGPGGDGPGIETATAHEAFEIAPEVTADEPEVGPPVQIEEPEAQPKAEPSELELEALSLKEKADKMRADARAMVARAQAIRVELVAARLTKQQIKFLDSSIQQAETRLDDRGRLARAKEAFEAGQFEAAGATYRQLRKDARIGWRNAKTGIENAEEELKLQQQ